MSSVLEETFIQYWRLFSPRLAPPLAEYRFDSKRKFKFDFAFVEQKLAIELEGGIWSNGRHTRGAGYTADCEKYNLAVERGWRVLRYTGDMLKNDPLKMIAQIQAVLAQEHKL